MPEALPFLSAALRIHLHSIAGAAVAAAGAGGGTSSSGGRQQPPAKRARTGSGGGGGGGLSNSPPPPPEPVVPQVWHAMAAAGLTQRLGLGVIDAVLLRLTALDDQTDGLVPRDPSAQPAAAADTCLNPLLELARPAVIDLSSDASDTDEFGARAAAAAAALPAFCQGQAVGLVGLAGPAGLTAWAAAAAGLLYGGDGGGGGGGGGGRAKRPMFVQAGYEGGLSQPTAAGAGGGGSKPAKVGRKRMEPTMPADPWAGGDLQAEVCHGLQLQSLWGILTAMAYSCSPYGESLLPWPTAAPPYGESLLQL